MTSLPIEARLPELKEILRAHRNAVLAAPPGAGKTTRVPLCLLAEAWLTGQKIILLEPRRLAARAAARRMAYIMNEAVGQTVGYRMRLERKVSAATRIEVVTEGVLTRLIQNDPALTGVGLVIFDEFHERSIHADTGLALCLDSQEGFRPDLRLLVMSATIDTEAISRMLGNAPIVQVQARQFPVETRYRPASSALNPAASAAEAVLRALREENGNILVFLPGIREIRQVRDRLALARLDASVVVAPLHGGLPGKLQDLAIEPTPIGRRKIVLSTSIAETSLTIEGIRIVIDSGLMRVSRFDIGSGMARLITIPVNRDTAAQRRGRAGRLEPGICYRLWSEEHHRMLLAHGSPEILNTDLTPLALELAAWGISNPDRLSWLDPPPTAAFNQARMLLTRLGALDNQGRITGHGKQLSALGLHPRLGHMIYSGKSLGLGDLACELAALLEERDILFLPPGQRDADLRLRVAELRSLSTGSGGTGSQGMGSGGNTADLSVDIFACRRARKTADHLKSRLNCQGLLSPLDSCGLLLAFAYPDRIASRRPGETLRYRLSNGRGAYFADPEPLCAEEYLVAASLDGEQQEAKIFLAAPVSYETLIGHFSEHITEQSQITWDHRSQAVKARREMLFGKAVLKDFPLPKPDPSRIAEALCDGIRREGIHLLPWTQPLRAWQARVLLLRRLDAAGMEWPDVSDETLKKNIEAWLTPYVTGITRGEHLRRIDLSSALFAMLTWKHRQDLDMLAPTHFTAPSGSRIPIDYTTGDTPVLSVRLQEMFGATETPTIAAGKLPLLIHLLSPAGRPVQITRDLKSFWAHAYYEVKKDLMGRYPKHHWPDDPWTAPATNRVKRRG
ncbi:MAG: ATP-dependent helicase HrpB [Deltaproteobacteria bacterium]|nr:ATP-dependent helicase HrpB [Deltaproteobacteria bacterium]